MPNMPSEYQALREAMRLCESKSDIICTFYSDPRLVRLQKDGKTRFVFGYCFDSNREAAAELANDKAAMFEILEKAGIAAVPHYLLSNGLKPEVSLPELEELFKKHGSLVIKPNGGNKGDLIAKFDQPEKALQYIEANPRVSWSASPYVDITREIRVVVLNGSVRLVCEKVKPKVINGLKMYNLTLGATAQSLKLTDIASSVLDLAVQSVKAIALDMGAVDIVFDHNGNPYVLEINDGFSLERFAASSSEAYSEVVNFYQHAITELFKD